MLKGFRTGVPGGVFTPPANSIPTGYAKRALISNVAPFRITATLPKGPMPTPVWQNDDLTALAEQPPDPVTGDVPDQSMTVLSDPTQKAAQRTKFHTPKNPLKKEDEHEEMRPTDNVLAGMKDRFYQAMIADVMSTEADVQVRQAKLDAIAAARMQNLDHVVTGEVTDQFIQDFRDWLCKKGRKVDHLRAGWWPADPANPQQPQKAIPKIIAEGGTLSDHPSVKHYVNRFVINRADFERDMVLMRAQAQAGRFLHWDINTLWKYYKYVVRGLVPDPTIAEDPDVLLTTESASRGLQQDSTNVALMQFAAPFLESLDNLSGQLGQYQEEVQKQNAMLAKLVEQQSAIMSAPPPPPPPVIVPPPVPYVSPLSSAAPGEPPTVQPVAAEEEPVPETVQPAIKPEPSDDDEEDEEDPLVAAPPADRPLPDVPPAAEADGEEPPPPPVPEDEPAAQPPQTPPRSNVPPSPEQAAAAHGQLVRGLVSAVPPPPSPTGDVPEIPADLPLDMEPENLDPGKLPEYQKKAREWLEKAVGAHEVAKVRIAALQSDKDWQEGGDVSEIDAKINREGAVQARLAQSRLKVLAFAQKLQRAMSAPQRRLLFTEQDVVHPIPSRRSLQNPPSTVQAKKK